MTRTIRPPSVASAAPARTGKLAGLFDGKVTFAGFHGSLPKARPDTMGTLLATSRPPFSALATNVKKHSNGVTSYDITPVGPKIAYKVAGLSNLEVRGADGKPTKLSIVEVNIGPDKDTGSKSVYAGRAYQVFGESAKGPWVAELWDNVKAENAFVDAAAGLHNGIVDGKVGSGGFRGLAKSAGELDAKNNGRTLEPDAAIPQVAVSESLLAFVSDPKNIPDITPEVRASIIATLKAQSAAAPAPAPAGWAPR